MKNQGLGKRVFLETLTSNWVVLGLSFVYAVITARYLGATERGLFGALTLWPTLLGGILTLGLPTAVVFQIRRIEGGALGLVIAGLLATAFLSIISVIAFDSFYFREIAGQFGRSAELARVLLAVLTPIGLMAGFLSGAAQALPGMRLFNVIRMVPAVFQLIALVLISVFWEVTPQNLAVANTIIAGTVLVIVAIGVFRALPPSNPVSGSILFAGLRYGVGVWAVELLGVLSAQVDKILIFSQLPLDRLGVYAVAYTASRVVATIPNAISTMILPVYAGQSIENIVAGVGRAFRLATLFSVLIFPPIAIIGSLAFPFVFGPSFSDSGHIFPFLVLECLIGANSWILGQALNAAGKPHLVVIRQVFGLLTGVSVMYYLLPVLGVWAVVLGMNCAGFIRLIITVKAFGSFLPQGSSLFSILIPTRVEMIDAFGLLLAGFRKIFRFVYLKN